MLSVFSLSVNLFPFSSLYNLSASPSSRHIFLDYFYIYLQCYSYFSPSFYNATPTLILFASYYFLFPSVRLLFDSLNLPIAVLLSSVTGKKFHLLLAAIRFVVLSFIGVVNVIDVANVVYAVDAVRCIYLLVFS